MKAYLSALALLLSLGFTMEKTAAQIVTTTSSSAPTTNIALSTTYTGINNLAWRANSAADYRDIFQSFTTTSSGFILDTISLKISSSTSTASNALYTLTLYTFPDSASLIPSSTLSSWTGNLPSSTSMTDGTYLTMDIPNFTLAANTVYGFELSYNQYSTNQSVNFYLGPGIYNGGLAFYNQNGTMTSSANDYLFILQTVPEASSLTLMLVALGFGVFSFRKQRDISKAATRL